MVNNSLIDLPIPYTIYNQRNRPLLMKFLRWWHLWNSHWENPHPVLVDRNLSPVDVKKISLSLSTRSKISIETRENPTFILTMGLVLSLSHNSPSLNVYLILTFQSYQLILQTLYANISRWFSRPYLTSKDNIRTYLFHVYLLHAKKHLNFEWNIHTSTHA